MLEPAWVPVSLPSLNQQELKREHCKCHSVNSLSGDIGETFMVGLLLEFSRRPRKEIREWSDGGLSRNTACWDVLVFTSLQNPCADYLI
jgi:hypothetical protein